MDPNTASAPDFVSSLEAMIQASSNAALDRRLGPASDSLDARIEAAVAAALDRRLGPEVVSLGNRMASLVEQRLANLLQERFADEAILAKQTGYTGATGKEQPAQKQNAIVSETSQTACSESAPESAPPPALSERWKHVLTSKETATIRPDGSKSAAFQPVADGLRKSKAIPRVLLEAKPDSKTAGQSSSLADTPNKRKANQKDQVSEAETGELDSSSNEGENDSHGKPIKKRARFELDPPGYTEGPLIQFRSNIHAACGQTRGNPRIVNLHSFTEASNKEDLTMADVVATFLFNYGRMSLDAFLDTSRYPAFELIRSESDRKTRPFVIQRRRESFRTIVKVFDLHQIARTRMLTIQKVRISP